MGIGTEGNGRRSTTRANVASNPIYIYNPMNRYA